MKILHICLAAFYIDNHSYQENMLPKYHKQMGYEVEIIASTLSFDQSGNACNVAPETYMNEYGIKVTRLPYAKGVSIKLGRFLRIYKGFYDELRKSTPDIIFVHGCQFKDIKHLVKYAKKFKIKIFVDNHADFSNSARNWISQHILHGILWRRCAQEILPYTHKFYGVLPARVDFLVNIYRIPAEKVELLVMGVDDQMVKSVNTPSNRKTIRTRYGIDEDDFLIITGGKIDHAKKQILHLLQAVKDSKDIEARVIVFGSVIDDLKENLTQLCDGEKIIYIGWLNNEEIYRTLSASDIAIYPGRHSVLWEQTVGLGIPIIVKYWDGTTHVDVGGNAKFLLDDSVNGIKIAIEEVIKNGEYQRMKNVAREMGMKEFSYERIAERSIN